MELFLNTTSLLLAFWIGFSIFTLLLVARSSLSFIKKMLIVPLTFLALYATITFTIDLLGLPFESIPKGEFRMLTYRVVSTDESQSILLWTIIDGKDRLYKFPFSKKLEEKLKKAKKRQQRGIAQFGKFKERSRFEHTESPDLKMYDFPIQKLIPKNK